MNTIENVIAPTTNANVLASTTEVSDSRYMEWKKDLDASTSIQAAPTTQLTFEKVRKMILSAYLQADTPSKKFPYVAQNTPLDSIGFPGETARSLHHAIRTGGRGLKDDREYQNWVFRLGKNPTLRRFVQSHLSDIAPFALFARSALQAMDAFLAA